MIKSLLFPSPLRNFPGSRWVRISIRTWHLASMGLLLGGMAMGHSLPELQIAFWNTLLSGVAFSMVELFTSFVWLLQLKGWAVMLKMLLLVGVMVDPSRAMAYLISAVIIGGISSHMQGKYRYYSVIHGEIVKE